MVVVISVSPSTVLVNGAMIKGVAFLLLVSCLSEVFSLNTCRWGITQRYNSKATKLPDKATVFLENTSVWFPLLTSDDAKGVKSLKLDFGAVNGDSMAATMTSVKSDGKSIVTSGTFTLNKDVLTFTDKESDGAYEIYPFKCSDNLMGGYRCKNGANGGDQFFAMARDSDSSAEIASELEECRRSIRNIANWVNAETLAHPDE